MTTELLKLSELHPAEYNPRKDLKPGDPEYEKIKNSIDRFGYVDPIIVNADGTIIGGHQRYKVMCDLGYEEAECVKVDLSKEDEMALNVALNKTGGDWDNAKLKELFENLQLSDYDDLEVTGFSEDEINDLIGPVTLSEAAQDDFDETNIPQRAHEGDIFQCGEHRVMCGSSTDGADIMLLMGGYRRISA